MNIPYFPITKIALFTDFDGTLIPIAATPDQVKVDSALKNILLQCHKQTQGAMAIVTGRSLEGIKTFLDLPDINLAASHGAQTRIFGAEKNHSVMVDEAIKLPVVSYANTHNLILEDKLYSLALHFRQAPQLESDIDDFLTPLIAGFKNLEILHGKFIREIKPSGINKGYIIQQIMNHPRFCVKLKVEANCCADYVCQYVLLFFFSINYLNKTSRF